MWLVPSWGDWEASPEHCRACHCCRRIASLTCADARAELGLSVCRPCFATCDDVLAGMCCFGREGAASLAPGNTKGTAAVYH